MTRFLKKTIPEWLLWGFFIAMGLVLLSPNTIMAAEKINYRLKWLFNASVVGDIVADANGLFAQAGLDVAVKEGGPERDAIRELELGHAQFGVASADQVIRALSKGSPVVVIAQLFQVNPLQWIYRVKDVQLEKIEDLRGQKIGITYGGNDETIMRTLLAKAKLGENDVSLFSVRYDYTPFFRRKVDIWPCYINSQGPLLKKKLSEAGEDVAFFNPAEFGIKFVANSVVTSAALLKSDPDLVATFTTALLKGWRQALDPANHQKTIDLLQKVDQDTPLDLLGKQLDLTRNLIHPEPMVAIGAIDVEAWRQTEAIMLAQKVIQKPVNVVDILKPRQ